MNFSTFHNFNYKFLNSKLSLKIVIDTHSYGYSTHTYYGIMSVYLQYFMPIFS